MNRIKLKRIFVVCVATLVSTGAQAVMLEVNVWEATPGKGAAMFEIGRKAKTIQEKHGARVVIGNEFTGKMIYSIRSDNWQTWNSTAGKFLADPAWQALVRDAGSRGIMKNTGNFLINLISPAPRTGNVFQTFVWEAIPGRTADLFAAAMNAQKIHTAAGAYVSVGADQKNRLMYMMSFDGWEHFAKFQDRPNSDAQNFMDEVYLDPPGRLVEVYTSGSVE